MNSPCHLADSEPCSARAYGEARSGRSLHARLLYAAAVLALGAFASVATAGPVRLSVQ